MQKRNTNKQLLFKLTQLEQLLRGMDFKSFKFLEDALKLSQRTIQRRIIELNSSSFFINCTTKQQFLC